jgi:5-formyltetrahydrofolate cyclo-ligase
VISAGKILVLPRISGLDLDWIAWDGNVQNLEKRKNLQEPTGPALSDLSTIDLIFVPALRIDRSGYRLGQGGGYYDRALAKISAFSIGLIHPDEIAGQDLPRESFDIPLSAAATPDLTLRFKR